MKPFNQLKAAQAEMLALLAEEAGEIVQAVGKVLRHGYDSCHPSGDTPNRHDLAKEIGDLLGVVRAIAASGDLSMSAIEISAARKMRRAAPYLHHQSAEAFVPIPIMDLCDFSRVNRARCEAQNGFNHQLGDWSLSDWFTATLGELGEASNVAKKLNRIRDGIPGNDKTTDELYAQLADEIADTFIYLDLLAQSQGISLAAAVCSKFERTSKKIGYQP